MPEASEGEIPQEAKDLTPLRGTVERLWGNVIELEECTMSRSGGYRVEQDGDEIVVWREKFSDTYENYRRKVVYEEKQEVGRWDYRKVDPDAPPTDPAEHPGIKEKLNDP